MGCDGAMDVKDDPLEDCSEGGELGRVNPRGESEDSAGEVGMRVDEDMVLAVASACRLRPRSRISALENGSVGLRHTKHDSKQTEKRKHFLSISKAHEDDLQIGL